MEQPLPCLFSSKRWANLYRNFINQELLWFHLPALTNEWGLWEPSVQSSFCDHGGGGPLGWRWVVNSHLQLFLL